MLARLTLVTVVLALPAASAEMAAAQPLDLDAWRGRVVLLDFWASWCIPCRQSFPWMQEMLAKYGERGLVVVAVNLDEDRQAAESFAVDHGNEFHHLSDPEGRIARAYGVDAMPSSILFDRQGRPVYRHAGFRLRDQVEYEAHLVALLEADTGDVPEALVITGRHDSGVQPWQRGAMARESMQLDADFLSLAFDDHMYFSKEASSGGRSFGGGGCGCN